MEDGIRRFYDEGSGDGGDGTVSPLDDPGAGGDGGTKPAPTGFADLIPEDLRGNSALAKFAGSETWAEELARGYVSASSHLGRDPANLVELPAVDNVEGRRGLMTKLGRPAEVKGYEVKLPAGAEHFFGKPEQLQAGFLTMAHGADMLPHQVQSVIDWFGGGMADIEKENIRTQQETAAAGLAAMQEKYGDTFNQRTALARHGINEVGGPELGAVLKANGLDFDPVVVEAFSKVGKMLFGEGSSPGGGSGGGDINAGPSPEEARAQGLALVQQSEAAKNPAEKRRLAFEADKMFSIATAGRQIGA